MANLSPEQAALLKQTYATAEDFKASANFKKMTPGAQKIALAAYVPVAAPVVPVEPTKGKPNTDPMILQQQLNVSGTNNQSTNGTPINGISDTNGTGVSQPENAVKTTKANELSKTDTSATRLAEIQKNLTDYTQTRPELFTDINQYKSFFGYDQRAPEQKKVLDSFFTTQQGVIAKQKANQDRYNTLSTMSQSDLMNITDVNDIGLINQDPNLAQKYQQAQNNKQMLEFVYGKDYGKTPAPQIDGLDGLPDNIQQEMAAANADITTTKNEMDKLQDIIDGTYNKLAKQAEGTGATDAYLRAKAGKINSELADQYNDLVRKYNSQLGTATSLNAMAQATKEEETMKRQERAQNLDMFNSMYGSFTDRNTSSESEDKNIGKTIDLGTAKAPKIMQWNPDTQRYDIPVSPMGGTSVGSWDGNRNGGNVTIPTTSQTSDITEAMRTYLLGLTGNTKISRGAIQGANYASLFENIKRSMTTDEKAAIDSANSISTDAAVVNSLVSGLTKLKSGIFNKTVRGLANVTGLTSTEQAKQAAAIGAINNLVAKYRNKLFGASLTPGEQTAANGFLPDTKFDSTQTIAAKMKALMALNDGVQENLVRQKLGLPRKELQPVITSQAAKIDAAFKTSATPQANKINEWESKNLFNTTPNTITTPGIYSQMVKGSKVYSFDGKQFKTLDAAKNARLSRRTSKGLKN